MSTIKDIVDYISDVEYYSHFVVPVESFETQENCGVKVSPAVLMKFLQTHDAFGIERCVAFINERYTIQVDDYILKVLKQQRRNRSTYQDYEQLRIKAINLMAGQDPKSVVYGYHIVVKFFKGYPSYAPVMTLSTSVYADDWFFGNGDIKKKALKKCLLK